VQGYKWLEREAAIVSQARLADLQGAMATLDWRLWDFLWTGEGPSDGKALPIVRMTLCWDEEEIDARQFLQGGERLEVQDLVFFGSPNTDPFVLGVDAQTPCASCPFLPIERSHVERLVRERHRQWSYELNSGSLPAAGTEVSVRIHERSD
jgi:hypothetical protein